MTEDDGPPPSQPPIDARRTAVQVVSAQGGFRIVLILLAIWTLVEGFALATGGLQALTLGGHDRNAERIIGAQMLVFVPVYLLLAFQREHYRLLTWIPYAAQVAIILPTGWGIIRYADRDGALLFLASSSFLTMLVYFWWQSHDPDFFRRSDEEPGPDDGDEAAWDGGRPPDDAAARARRYRRR